MPKIIVHADFRIEIKVNPVFYEGFGNTGMESEKIVRLPKKVAGKEGLEPSTNRLTVCCANQLRHFPTHSQKISNL